MRLSWRSYSYDCTHPSGSVPWMCLSCASAAPVVHSLCCSHALILPYLTTGAPSRDVALPTWTQIMPPILVFPHLQFLQSHCTAYCVPVCSVAALNVCFEKEQWLAKYWGELKGCQMYQLQQTNKGKVLSLQSLLPAMIAGGVYRISCHHLFLDIYLLTLFTIYLIIFPHAPPAPWLSGVVASLCHPRSYGETGGGFLGEQDTGPFDEQTALEAPGNFWAPLKQDLRTSDPELGGLLQKRFYGKGKLSQVTWWISLCGWEEALEDVKPSVSDAWSQKVVNYSEQVLCLKTIA